MDIDYSDIARGLSNRIGNLVFESEQYRHLAEKYVKLYEEAKQERDDAIRELETLRGDSSKSSDEASDGDGPNNVR